MNDFTRKILVLSCAALLAACATSRRPPSFLAPDDGAALRVTALRLLLDSAASTYQGPGARIWMVPYGGVEPYLFSDDPPRPPLPSARDSAALLNAFPGLRYEDAPADLYECPPGVRLRLPGQGCPIRDAGLIVSLGPALLEGDSVTVGAVLRESSTGTARVSSWAASYEVILAWVDGRWMLRRIRTVGIT